MQPEKEFELDSICTLDISNQTLYGNLCLFFEVELEDPLECKQVGFEVIGSYKTKRLLRRIAESQEESAKGNSPAEIYRIDVRFPERISLVSFYDPLPSTWIQWFAREGREIPKFYRKRSWYQTDLLKNLKIQKIVFLVHRQTLELFERVTEGFSYSTEELAFSAKHIASCLDLAIDETITILKVLRENNFLDYEPYFKVDKTKEFDEPGFMEAIPMEECPWRVPHLEMYTRTEGRAKLKGPTENGWTWKTVDHIKKDCIWYRRCLDLN